ncbi:unnamed protein product, partial [Closterium sp. NIES-54]
VAFRPACSSPVPTQLALITTTGRLQLVDLHHPPPSLSSSSYPSSYSSPFSSSSLLARPIPLGAAPGSRDYSYSKSSLKAGKSGVEAGGGGGRGSADWTTSIGGVALGGPVRGWGRSGSAAGSAFHSNLSTGSGLGSAEETDEARKKRWEEEVRWREAEGRLGWEGWWQCEYMGEGEPHILLTACADQIGMVDLRMDM